MYKQVELIDVIELINKELTNILDTHANTENN